MRDLYTESMALSLNGKEYHITEQGKATLSQAGGATVSMTDVPNSALAGLESGLLFKSLKIRLSTMPDESFMLKIGFIEETVTAMHSLFRQHAGN